MCRFTAYIGKDDYFLDEVLIKPSNSLLNQSLHPKESRHHINADGFGVSWHNLKHDQIGSYKSFRPAWNDPNFYNIVHMIETNAFLAHIRAATKGDVSYHNSHPFTYKNWSFVHNGNIDHFDSIKKKIINILDESLYLHIKGSTDSEHLFMLIMQYHFVEKLKIPLAIKKAIATFIKLQIEINGESTALINIAMINGTDLYATKFTNGMIDPNSLYYCHKIKEKGLFISSEPLQFDDDNWVSVGNQQLIHFKPKTNKLTMTKINI